MYRVISGTVRVEKGATGFSRTADHSAVVNTLQTGQTFGEMSFLDDETTCATCIADSAGVQACAHRTGCVAAAPSSCTPCLDAVSPLRRQPHCSLRQVLRLPKVQLEQLLRSNPDLSSKFYRQMAINVSHRRRGWVAQRRRKPLPRSRVGYRQAPRCSVTAARSRAAR